MGEILRRAGESRLTTSEAARSGPIILDGRAVAHLVKDRVRQRVECLRGRGLVPKLGVLMAGDYAPSKVYVRNKEKACRAVGIETETVRLSETASIGQVLERVEVWNQDPSVHGMIVQLPLPDGLDARRAIECIDPRKDVDGLTSVNLGRLMAGGPCFVPATPAGIVELLMHYGISLRGANVVIIGRGNLVGKPLANLLLLRGERGDATVTVCHTQTRDLAQLCQRAEILVSAVGQANLVTGEMVSSGVVVVDAGTSQTPQGVVGDVEFATVAPKARAITPVPGGVGPMTVAMLLENLVSAAERQQGDAGG